jgi:hypothetical protein
MDKVYSVSIRTFTFIQKYFPEGVPYESLSHDAARCALEIEFNAVAASAALRCAEIANGLVVTHAEAYQRAELAEDKDAATFIAGLRDGAAGCRDQIRREFDLDNSDGDA